MPAVVLLAACSAEQPSRIDRDIASYIESIRAIDVHAHPLRFVADGAPRDSEYDALPLDGLPPFGVPYGLHAEHPQYRDAQVRLFGVSATDTGANFAKTLGDARKQMLKQHGEKYAEWVLDQAGIETMLANRIAMGSGLPSSRFKWIPFVDPLMLPLDTHAEAARSPDFRALYPLEDKLLVRYLAELGVTEKPATLDEYEAQVVRALLDKQKGAGAIGIKFEAAYLRPLNFGRPDTTSARAIYARYVKGGTPTHAEYVSLQDYLFHAIAWHAGQLGLTIQIHSAEGFGAYYSPEGAAPHNLESTFNDSTLRATTFVITHGGWPRTDETMALLEKPNVYADIALMNVLAEPNALALTLRKWLADSPDKILFGTDAFDGGDAQGWEQVAWVAAHNSRVALAEALSGMMHDGEISRDRAKELARMVLRENAFKAYHLK